MSSEPRAAGIAALALSGAASASALVLVLDVTFYFAAISISVAYDTVESFFYAAIGVLVSLALILLFASAGVVLGYTTNLRRPPEQHDRLARLGVRIGLFWWGLLALCAAGLCGLYALAMIAVPAIMLVIGAAFSILG